MRGLEEQIPPRRNKRLAFNDYTVQFFSCFSTQRGYALSLAGCDENFDRSLILADLEAVNNAMLRKLHLLD